MPVVKLLHGGLGSPPQQGDQQPVAPPEEQNLQLTPLPTKFPHDLAWRGVLQRWRDAVGPGTESADEFHFASAISVIGSLIGRHYFVNYPYPHYCNFFVCLVGPTARARKTSAMRCATEGLLNHLAARSIMAQTYSISEGLSGSGEGLLEAVADNAKTGGRSLFICEDELSVVLRKMRTENSTLGAFLVQAADGRSSLRLATRRKPLVATGPNIGLLSASTSEWLEQDTREEDIRGGLINRIMWFYGTDKASQSRPRGADKKAIEAIRADLAWLPVGPAHITKQIELDFDADADRWYDEWYKAWREKPSLSSLAAAATARAHSHAIRLAGLYSLLDDRSGIIRLEHIQAATAVTEYCSAVAQHIFMTAAHDREAKADRAVLEVLRAVKPGPSGRPGPMRLRDLHNAACPGMGGTPFFRLVSSLASLHYIGVNNENGSAWYNTL